MIRPVAIALVALAVAVPAVASPTTVPVTVQFEAFDPGQTDVLPGETVQWTNVSERRHTVTADDGSFDSGDLFGGNTFSQRFDSAGIVPYHCRVHAGMVGEIDVRPVILDPLPPTAVPAGDQVVFSGRTSDQAQPVQIERAVGGAFVRVASATPAADGTWKASLVAAQSADYRATIGAGSSETRRLLVSDRKVLVRTTRRGVAVSVYPPLPYARIVVQEYLRERFGWWPAISGRLDYVSQASFRIPARVKLRVVLVDKDGWTPLATSPVVRSGRER